MSTEERRIVNCSEFRGFIAVIEVAISNLQEDRYFFVCSDLMLYVTGVVYCQIKLFVIDKHKPKSCVFNIRHFELCSRKH